MPNLSIENIGQILQPEGGGIAPEGRVVREMRKEGLPLATEPIEAVSTARTFSEVLRQSVEQVNLHQHQADQAIKELVAGRTKNIHETMLAIERADSSLKMMMQVRNKILDAYKEVMRMQV